ncbi:C40 family peptidase [Rhodobacter sp. Har01]|uniref:C40 family peptidase n=1 Tax=Rhodobacter sp. Har01 TaxID=2883999 RepID=UPI001D0891B3|nr:NlpC/P60 family protein [Rhodobacter sp. Har01]MCB6179818.1 C40 family peptidase [Rhodobacter sp. Har01]
MDRRLTPFSGRKALPVLQGQVQAEFTTGEPARIATPLAPLLANPGGAIDRTLICGDAVTVIDRRDDHAFLQAAKDGYCGWVAEADLGPWAKTTHRVTTPATHAYPEPRVQARPATPLYLNARVLVLSDTGKWAETPLGFVPSSHIAPEHEPASDPVAVAETLLHAPYLWGGNSVTGVDCSGLVQLAFHAAGRPCPADSDLQRSIGHDIPEGAPMQRGDLIFWKGHVALLTAPDRIFHATGHKMRVTYEPLADAITRIAAEGTPVLARRRP